MCKFFSCISDGKGKVLFFTLKDIEEIEKKGNPDNYKDWNSHTSIAHYNKILGAEEDKWNKWEYNNETKELKVDSLNTTNDKSKVKKIIEKYIADNNAIYLQKVYKSNSGDSNSGNRNSGNRNSGDWNSGYRNSGYRNSGDSNSGDRNSGDRNSGDRNSGDRNSGYRNSGNRNSGDWNSGDWNSGDRNSGYSNSDKPFIRMFNKMTKLTEPPSFPDYWYFDLNEWINVSEMTNEDKKKYYWYKTTDGYLRKIEYKEAWKLSFDKASKEDVAKTLKLPNFNYNIFEEISGITKKMINKKLK